MLADDPALPPGLRPAQRAVVAHVTGFFSDRSVEVSPFDDGPIRERVPGFAVICVRPAVSGQLCVYVSCGVWDANAYYHANSDESFRLDVGHTVPLGEPWLPGSSLDHLLVSQPYPHGPEFEMCRWEGGHARILWLLPITESERDFKGEHGLEALEQRFDDARLRYWDPGRPAVV